jgi:histidinol-phosphate aminotransferase
MAPYNPPQGGRVGRLRLDFNENTLGCSPEVIARLKHGLTAEAVAVYPDYEEATRELAAFFSVAPEELLLTNGTDEAIQVLVHTFVDGGDDVLLFHPSYAMYRFYAQLAGAVVRELPYRPDDLAFPLDACIAAIRPGTRAVFIANPNNPTGTAIDLAAIRRILEAAPNAAVMIDEAYFDFYGVTALPLLRNHPNLFVSRTFSKAYGMAAMRCGCLFSCAENVRWLRKAQSPYSVNGPAVLAARAAILDPGYVESYAREVVLARELVYEGLRKLGIPFSPSHANFVLFHAGERAIPIRDALRERGVLIRDRSYEIPGCVRVTVGDRLQMERFLDELEAAWTR